MFTGADHEEPPLVDLSIMYPVIGEPPLFVGAFQLRLICDEETAVAINPVGGEGGVGEDDTALNVVADAVFDGWLVPAELMAETRYV